MATRAASDVLAKRSTSLVAFWEEGQLYLENYVSRRRVGVHPAVLQLIDACSEFVQVSQLRQSFGESADASGLIDLLLEHDILIVQGGDLDKKEKLLDGWCWGQDARYFHFATRDVQYTFDADEVREHFEAKARHTPPPSPLKSCGGPFVELPTPQPIPGTLHEALINRRTIREFSREPLRLEELSDILFWTWGKQRFFNESALDRRVLKTSPSGGARHPIEVYVAAQRTVGLDAGIYHYSVERHGLELLQPGVDEHQMVELFSGQGWVQDAAALFMMTAVLRRSMWKYDHSRAYRVVQLDAGHLGQTFHLVCTALGLGPFTTAALQDEAIETALALDGVTEVTIYGAAVGRMT